MKEYFTGKTSDAHENALLGPPTFRDYCNFRRSYVNITSSHNTTAMTTANTPTNACLGNTLYAATPFATAMISKMTFTDRE
jgi:hypothetical protein